MAKPLTFRVPDVVNTEVEKLADEQDSTKSEILRDAIINGLGDVKLPDDEPTIEQRIQKINAISKGARSKAAVNGGEIQGLKRDIDYINSKPSPWWGVVFSILLTVILWGVWGL